MDMMTHVMPMGMCAICIIFWYDFEVIFFYSWDTFSSCRKNKKIGWTEEQEEELRQLFMENQNNPSTEKGTCHIITW